MPNRIKSVLVLAAVLPMLLVAWRSLATSAAAAPGQAPPVAPTPEPRRERQGSDAAPEISFIDSPDAACYRTELDGDMCLINWSYISVNATAPQYVISMTIAIDGQLVAANWGFFQQSMFVPAELYDGGFRVSCGPPGAAGIPNLGRSYGYVIRARETGGLGAANYGSVTCPAGLSRTYLPLVWRSAP